MIDTLIPYPDVPAFPGVPALNRQPSEPSPPAPDGTPSASALIVTQGSMQDALVSALQQPQQWGIFDAITGAQLGIISDSMATLSTFSLDFLRETRVSDFPVQASSTSSVSFSTFNKVTLPANPKVVCILDGEESDRTNFLNAIEAASLSTNLYNVVTPTVTYMGYTIDRYSYSRKASKGAVLISVEVSLKEVRQVSAALNTAATPSPIVSPQDPASSPQVNGGMQQPATPSPSLAQSWNMGAQNFIGAPTD